MQIAYRMHEAQLGCGTMNKKKPLPIASLLFSPRQRRVIRPTKNALIFPPKPKSCGFWLQIEDSPQIIKIFLLQTCCQYNGESNEASDVASSIHGCSIQLNYTRVFGLNQAIFQLHKLLHYFHWLFTILFFFLFLFIFVLSNRPISLDSIQFLCISHFTFFVFGWSFRSFFGKHFPSIFFLCLLWLIAVECGPKWNNSHHLRYDFGISLMRRNCRTQKTGQNRGARTHRMNKYDIFEREKK